MSQTRTPAGRLARDGHARVHRTRPDPRTVHVPPPGRGERIPGAEGGHDHRRDLSRRRHRHGGAADPARQPARGELRPDRRLDRRVDRRRRDLHHPGVRHSRALGFQVVRRVLRGLRPDDRRRHPGHPLRHHPAPRDGRGRGAALPRVEGRLGDPPGRPAGFAGRRDALPGDGRRGADQAPRRAEASSRRSTSSTRRSARSARAWSAWATRRTPTRSRSGAARPSRRRPSRRPISALATSSDPNWPP